jgi:hypothetical protein
MKPQSVSWSNCIDFIEYSQFHCLARQIGSEKCVHFAYSMNWIYVIFGSTIIDVANARQTLARNKILDGAKMLINKMWQILGLSKLLRFPPVTYAINYANYANYAMQIKQSKNWIEYFLSAEVAQGCVNYDQQKIGQANQIYSPLYHSSSVINFEWSYDMKMKLRFGLEY